MQTGQILAELRKTQRLSQLDLALRADVSSRHLSFIETGRSQASAPMLKRLALELELAPVSVDARSCGEGRRWPGEERWSPMFGRDCTGSQHRDTTESVLGRGFFPCETQAPHSM